MACSNPTDGYATPAAMIISLGLALVAVAVAAHSTADMQLARQDLDQARLEYALAGAQTLAAVKIMDGAEDGPSSWDADTEAGVVRVSAEPEGPKLSLVAGARLPDSALVKFKVADPTALRARLQGLATQPPGDAEVAEADQSPLWRSCAASLMSPFGQASSLAGPSEQSAVGQSAGGHTGEVWRIKVTSQNGWSDDRLVRFAGDAARPIAVIRRRWTHEGGEGSCDDAIKID